HLFINFIVHVADQPFVAIDNGGHPHRPVRVDPPGRFVDTGQAGKGHCRHPYTSTIQEAVQTPLSSFETLSAVQVAPLGCQVGGCRAPSTGSPTSVPWSRIPSIVPAKRENNILRTAISYMIALSHSTNRSSTSGASHSTLTETAGRTSAVVTTAVSARAACSKASAAVFPKPRTPTSAACWKCSHLGSP